MELKNRCFGIGDVVSYFKRNETHSKFEYLYVIKDFCRHTENGEILVVYDKLGTGEVYARPFDMFMSEVDRQKYPNVKQKYRFEKVVNICKYCLHYPKYLECSVGDVSELEFGNGVGNDNIISCTKFKMVKAPKMIAYTHGIDVLDTCGQLCEKYFEECDFSTMAGKLKSIDYAKAVYVKENRSLYAIVDDKCLNKLSEIEYYNLLPHERVSGMYITQDGHLYRNQELLKSFDFDYNGFRYFIYPLYN